MKIKFIIVILFISTFLGHSQTAEEVLKRVNNEYASTNYLQFETKYNLYKNKSEKNVYESYIGQFKKNEKNEIYQKIDKTEFFWNNSYCLRIIHPDKLMTLTQSQPVAFGDIDIKDLLDYCKIKSFVDKKSYWELTLESKPLSGLSYSKIIVHINKKYFIQKQLFYYSSGINFSKDYRNQDINYPVLEIIYSKHNRNKIESKYFDVSQYLSVSKNNIKPTPQFSNYKFEDHREVVLK